MVRIIVTVVIVGLLGGAGTFLYSTFGSQIQALLGGPASTDYEGAGTGEVMFKIGDGDFGEAIASNLESDGVVKSADTFYSLLLKQNPQPVFQIGTYKLASKMSAKSALTALLDPSSKVDFNVTIPEGMVAADILSKLADTTGIPLADFDSAAADYSSFGLPTEAPRIEGYLFPATYAFEPGQTPHQILQTMVDRTFQSLDAAGVAPADRHRVLTLAALIQKEAGPIPGDFAKVSRVFTNRLDIGMLLQSDATVAYGSGQTHRVETTEAERGDPNLYNTYVNPGLPVGPISNPGDDAIAAALHPADGPWLYFVTWNLETGETIFSVTGEEHEAAVEQWQAWMKEHPEYE